MFGKKSGEVAKLVVAMATTASLVLSTPGLALACTQVYVGSSLTANGEAIYGREEDYGPRYVKSFGVQEATDGRTYISGESDFSRTVGHTYRYTYVRDAESEWEMGFPPYSEAGINEKGVTCSATLTTAANDAIDSTDPGTDAGLGEYNLTDVILGEAATAREGVQIVGSIMDDVGTGEHNQILIGDPNEVWVFMQLSGHQWCAIKMPDDVASVNPNMGNLQFKVDLDDTSVCLHSANMEQTAIDAGTAVYYDDGTFNVAASYGEDNSGTGQNTRYAQGRAYLGAALGEGDYTTNDSGQVTQVAADARQLFFTPGRSDYSLYDVQRALAARGEGTVFDANTNTALYSIGNNRGVESHLFQTRKGMSADIATIQWEALSCTEFNVYVPSYSALLTEVPDDIYDDYDEVSEAHAGGRGSKGVTQAMTDSDDDIMGYVFMDINTLAYNNRSTCGDGVAAYLKALQEQVNAQQATVDGLMQSTPEADRTELANKAFDAVSHEVYKKADQLRTELREYLQGDQSEPFTPSDLGFDGDLATPLAYSTALIAPEITTAPADATYKTGEEAQPLTVEATEKDGVEGSDDALTYEWFEKAADGTLTSVGTGDSFTPGTDEAGTHTYLVRVTNGAGLTTDSDPVTVTVVDPVAPVITLQPESATYTLGDTALPLTVEATDPDGDDAKLTYQWYELVTDDSASAPTPTATGSIFATMAFADEGATNMVPLGTTTEYTPDISQVGTRTYMVRVTDEDGLHTDSDQVTVTVKKSPASAKDDSISSGKTPSSGKAATARKTGGRLMPQTGDEFSAVPVVGVGLVGVAAVCVGVYLRKKKHTD